MRFGEFLLQSKSVDTAILNEALYVQGICHGKIGRILRDLGYLSQLELNQSLTFFLKPALQESATIILEKVKALTLPPEVKRWSSRYPIIVYSYSNSQLIYLSSALQDEITEAAEKEFRLNCTAFLLEPEVFMFLQSNLEDQREFSKGRIHVQSVATDEEKLSDQDPYTALFRDAVWAAKQAGASDIHISPTAEGLDLKFRINGDLQIWKKLSVEHRQSFTNKVKYLANVPLSTRGEDRDSRISLKAWKLELRVNLLPMHNGENIVLRLLDQTRKFVLNELGLEEQTAKEMLEALHSSNGIFLVSGPTGSGKTTTLYTLLNCIDRHTKNVITIEDPIEYTLPGLNQVPVTRKMTFAKILRSVLRQDPDAIFVGEIRDFETADLAVKAAATGHLVLSTIHANSASEVVQRLLNLGVDSYMLKSVLRFSSAQRLVKRICTACSISVSKDKVSEVLKSLPGVKNRYSEVTNLKERNPNGCDRCKGVNLGRVSIVEYMNGNQIREYLTGDNLSLPPQLAISLQEACLQKSLKGEVDVTNVSEVA